MTDLATLRACYLADEGFRAFVRSGIAMEFVIIACLIAVVIVLRWLDRDTR